MKAELTAIIEKLMTPTQSVGAIKIRKYIKIGNTYECN